MDQHGRSVQLFEFALDVPPIQISDLSIPIFLYLICSLFFAKISLMQHFSGEFLLVS